MKIVAISDTHNQHGKLVLPDGDVLIHAGDATMSGKPWELFPFIEWMGRQPHRVKLFVPGNHDFDVEKNTSLYKRVCAEHGIRLLVDEAYSVIPTEKDDQRIIKFYGAPWVPNLEGWAFYQPHLGLINKFAKIPMDTDVLITHGPPEGTLDVGPAGNAFHIGSSELRDRVRELGELRLHVFGHIHHGYGRLDHPGGHTSAKVSTEPARISVNAAICTEEYQPTNKPIVVEV